MTDHKLLKYLNKPFVPPVGNKQLTPVVISDSKGLCLRRASTTPFELQIKWWSVKGRTSEQALNWLRENLAVKVGHLDNISAYIWLGTCDLTAYKDGFVSLKSETEETIQTVTSNFQQIVELFKEYPGCKLTFLETPIYSIYEWNVHRGHPEPLIYKQQDNDLIQQIQQVNAEIKNINQTLGSRTPKFTDDIRHPTNSKSKNDHRKPRDQYNFKLYKDGIHPDRNLARVWLRKISNQVKNDCW